MENLSNEELLEIIRSGSSNLKQAENQIIANLNALVWSLAHSYYFSYRRVSQLAQRMDLDDFYQAGCEGVVFAIKNWREDGGASFSTYAYGWIESRIRREIQKTGYTIYFPNNRIPKDFSYSFESSFTKGGKYRDWETDRKSVV